MNRRDLFRSSLGLGAVALLRAQNSSSPAAPGIQLGVATYSLRSFRRDTAIRMIKQMGISYADVKEFHLPYNDSPKELAEGRKKFDAAGIRVIGGGNVSMKETDEAGLKRWFDYAKACEFPIIVAAPTKQNLPLVQKLAREYNVKIAIHNHGPEDKEFPTPQSVLDAVKDMDPRMGLCIDIGHTARAGADPIASISAAGQRLFEMHFKDLKDTSPHAQQVPVGEGVLPIPAIFKELRKIGYSGTCSLEYEIDEDDPVPGMQRSFAYMRGVLAGQEG
jgi:sugar phosphate isomerase/epimerase